MLLLSRRQRVGLFPGMPSLATGLVAGWPLDEAGGVRRAMHGGPGLILNDTNSVMSAAGLASPRAALFASAASEYLSLSAALNAPLFDIGATSFSIAVWVYPTSLTTNNRIVLGRDDVGAAGSRDFNIVLVQTTGVVRFFVHAASSSSGTGVFAQADSSTAVSINGWHLVIGQWSAQENVCRVSVNATAQAVSSTLAAARGTTVADLRVGRIAGAAPQYYSGRMSQALVWQGRSLSGVERAWLYSGGRGREHREIVPWAA